MNHTIAQILADSLTTLVFKDKITGLVKSLRVKKGETEKIIPIAYNTNPTTCNESELLDYTPDSTKRSIIYFEDRGTSFLNESNGYLFMQSRLQLVCWFNYKLIDKTLYQPDRIAGNIIKLIPDRLPNQSNLIGILVTFTGQDPIDSDPFIKYSYREFQSQFMTYPYGYTALNYQIDYRIRKECIDDIVLNIDSCP